MTKISQKLFSNSKLRTFIFVLLFAMSFGMMGTGISLVLPKNKQKSVKADTPTVYLFNGDDYYVADLLRASIFGSPSGNYYNIASLVFTDSDPSSISWIISGATRCSA